MNKVTRDFIETNRPLILKLAADGDRTYFHLLKNSIQSAVRVLDFFETHPGSTVEDAAVDLGLHPNTIHEFVSCLNLERLSGTSRGGRPPTKIR